MQAAECKNALKLRSDRPPGQAERDEYAAGSHWDRAGSANMPTHYGAPAAQLPLYAYPPAPLSLHIAMQRERPFEYAATSFSVRPWPMRIRPVVIVIALVAAVVASAAAAAAASAVVVAPSYC